MWWLPWVRSSNPSHPSRRRKSSKLMLASDWPCKIRIRSSSYLPMDCNLPQVERGAWATSSGSPRRRFLVGSRQHEAFALRLGNVIPELFRGVDPQLDSFVGVDSRLMAHEKV